MKKLIQIGIVAWICHAFMSHTLHAESSAELLEKGVYQEETAGNLDEAIEIYKRVLENEKKSRALAAQAQLRIGQCLLRKKQDDAARAAFRTVVERFADQKEIVSKAKEHLPAEEAAQVVQPAQLPVPWKSGERTTLVMRLAGGQSIGIVGTRVVSSNDAMPTWEMSVRRYVWGGASQGTSHVRINATQNTPVAAQFKHTILGSTSTQYEDKQVLVNRIDEVTGKVEESKIAVDPSDGVVVANDQCFFLLRQLPLAVNYTSKLLIRDGMAGGTPIAVLLTVPKKEVIETPLGNFDCFRVEMNIGQTFWIADTPERLLVRFDAGGVVATIAARDSDQTERILNKQSGLSIVPPSDWFYDITDPDADRPGIHLVASDMLAAWVATVPQASLEEEAKGSVDSWLKHLETRLSGQVKGLQALPVEAIEVAGVKGIRQRWDCQIGKVPFVVTESLAFVGDRAVRFSVVSEKSHFEKPDVQMQLDQIRDSIQLP